MYKLNIPRSLEEFTGKRGAGVAHPGARYHGSTPALMARRGRSLPLRLYRPPLPTSCVFLW